MARKKKVQYSEKVLEKAHEWNMLFYEFDDKNHELYVRYVDMMNRISNELTVTEYNQMLKVIEDTKISCGREYYERKAEEKDKGL